MFKNYQKGVSLYLALMIMFILIAIGLGISLIIVSQMKMIKGMGDSVIALYAADTGIEHSLYNKRKEGGTGVFEEPEQIGDANYTVAYEYTTYEGHWKSVGAFKKVKRAIDISMFTVTPVSLRRYTLDCLGDCGNRTCSGGATPCSSDEECSASSQVGPCTDSADCPGHKANSVFVSGICPCLPPSVFACQGCDYQDGTCVDFASCRVTQDCVYECEAGFIWDSATETCKEGG